MTIQQMLENLNIKKFTIHDDRSVTAHQSVSMSHRKFTKIPIKFRIIEGSFNCSDNKLINLINAPQKTEGFFDCSSNSLTTLFGAPKIIEGWFYCDNNLLLNLNNAPQIVKGNFSITYNKYLINLDGLPVINGNIICDNYLYEDINYQRHLLKKQIRDIE